MPISAVMIREEQLDRRHDERWLVLIRARRLDARPDAQALTIVDLSASGILIEVERPLPVGTSMIVELPTGVSKICRTVWSCGSHHGAQFSEALNDFELDSLLSPMPVHLPDTEEAEVAFERSQSCAGVAGYAEDDEASLSPGERASLIIIASASLWGLIAAGVWLAGA
jgi:hypothetical protein